MRGAGGTWYRRETIHLRALIMSRAIDRRHCHVFSRRNNRPGRPPVQLDRPPASRLPRCIDGLNLAVYGVPPPSVRVHIVTSAKRPARADRPTKPISHLPTVDIAYR